MDSEEMVTIYELAPAIGLREDVAWFRTLDELADHVNDHLDEELSNRGRPVDLTITIIERRVPAEDAAVVFGE